MRNRIRVLVADDQAIAREGFQHILEREVDMDVVGIVQTAPEVLLQVREKIPDVVLLDLKWYRDDQAMNAVIAQLRREFPRICIIGITVYDQLMQQAKIAGADWVTTKDVGKDELLSLIRSAYAANTQKDGKNPILESSSRKSLVDLRHNLLTHFSEDELRTLCFDLGVDFEALSGENKDGKVRELVAFLERRGRIPELIATCRELRPSAFGDNPDE